LQADLPGLGFDLHPNPSPSPEQACWRGRKPVLQVENVTLNEMTAINANICHRSKLSKRRETRDSTTGDLDLKESQIKENYNKEEH
jgi:hypothetical protein